MAEDKGVQPVGKIVPLVWEEPGLAVLANQALLQFDGNLVYLTFGQTKPPLITGDTEEEKREQLEKVHSIAVSPVARIAMTADGFRAVAGIVQKHLALIENIEKLQQKKT